MSGKDTTVACLSVGQRQSLYRPNTGSNCHVECMAHPKMGLLPTSLILFLLTKRSQFLSHGYCPKHLTQQQRRQSAAWRATGDNLCISCAADGRQKIPESLPTRPNVCISVRDGWVGGCVVTLSAASLSLSLPPSLSAGVLLLIGPSNNEPLLLEFQMNSRWCHLVSLPSFLVVWAVTSPLQGVYWWTWLDMIIYVLVHKDWILFQ